ncbi:MAG: TauD/TfdA dioxygenase family protein [Hylemonella sp.]|jgi:taurine dioxygenase
MLANDIDHTVKVIPSGRAIEADIAGVDLSRNLSSSQIDEIQQAWSRHLVLRFRNQEKLTMDQLIAFSRHFGPLDNRPKLSYSMSKEHDELPPEIAVISNVKVGGKPLGALGDGEAVWHADMTYNEKPPKGACLLAKEIPPSGGDTHFANMYMAYEELSQDLKQRIQNLSCVHDASRNSAGELRLGFTDNSDPTQTVGAVHPLVTTKTQTGERALLLGRRRNAYIKGLSLDESESLLDLLWAHATQKHFTWTQVWSVGDLVMWDNTCTMHRRDAFDPDSRRLMLRTQIAAS